MWLWVIKRAAAAADPPLSRSTNMGGGETAALNGVYLPVVATTDPLRQGAGVPFAVREAALSPVAACASLLEVEALVRHLCPGVRLKEVYVCMCLGFKKRETEGRKRGRGKRAKPEKRDSRER